MTIQEESTTRATAVASRVEFYKFSRGYGFATDPENPSRNVYLNAKAFRKVKRPAKQGDPLVFQPCPLGQTPAQGDIIAMIVDRSSPGNLVASAWAFAPWMQVNPRVPILSAAPPMVIHPARRSPPRMW